MELPATFHHSRGTRVMLTGFLAAAVVAAYLASQLPGELGWLAGLLLVPVVLLFGHRWYLTFRWLELTHDSVRLHHPWGSREVAYRDILRARFDSAPYDLILTTHEREYRVPRTLLGFQRAHDQILAHAGLKNEEALPLEMRAKRSLRALGVLALAELGLVLYLMFRQGTDPFALAFCGSLVISALVILDQCVFRRCRWQHDGVWVEGLFGKRFYDRKTLERAQVSKRTLWSRLQLDFGRGGRVTIEDKLFDLPVVRLARLIEQDWGCAVVGTGPTPPRRS